MSTRAHWITRRALALAVAVFGVVAIAGTALAGHQTSGVKSYTGCLVSGDGVLIKIKEGNSPKSACTGGQVEAHFSGGDITKISVGSGLSLPNGGDNGEVRIVLDASHSLPQGCADGRVAEWDSGTDKWICGEDDDTTYSAGTGLHLSAANQFSIEPAYRVKNTPDCSSGQFATGFDGDGDVQCAAPSAPAPHAWYRATSHAEAPEGDPQSANVVFEIPLLAGTYLAQATGVFDGDSVTDEVDATCQVAAGSGGGTTNGEGADDESIPFAIVTIVVLTATGKLELRCYSEDGGNHIDFASLVVTKLGSVDVTP